MADMSAAHTEINPRETNDWDFAHLARSGNLMLEQSGEAVAKTALGLGDPV